MMYSFIVFRLKLTKEQASKGIGKADKSGGSSQVPCIPPLNVTTCIVLNSATNTYHSSDGLCNNVNNPGWGATNQPYRRILLPAYEDGKETKWRSQKGQ